MKMNLKWIVVLLTAIVMVGCNADDNNKENDMSNQNEESSEDLNNTEESKETNESVAADYETFPLPVLDGWEEDETSFKTIGNETIDLWNGQFTFEGEIEDYFESYQAALKEYGYEVTITEDVEGKKNLAFEQVIDGDKYEGFANFSQNLFTGGVQRFK